MNSIDPKQATIFVIILAVIALVINSTREYGRRENSGAAFRQQVQQPVPEPTLAAERQREMEAAAAHKAAQEDAAAKRAQFVARYLNNTSVKQPGVTAVAVVVMSENRKLNNTVATAFARHFDSGSVRTLSSLFTPEFISDGLFESAAGGSSDVVSKLDLANSLDTLLLAKQTVQYSRNPSLENTITANMQLEVTAVSVAVRGRNQTWTFSANGAGFSQTQAREMAEERLMKQISDDTNIVVSP